MEKENKSQGTTDYKTVFGITGTKHCEKKDKPFLQGAGFDCSRGIAAFDRR